jgi:hypothetical protein
MYVIVAVYNQGQRLYYAGPEDASGASRNGVHRFTEMHNQATQFPGFFSALRASWRATPPRKYESNMLTSLKVDKAT